MTTPSISRPEPTGWGLVQAFALMGTAILVFQDVLAQPGASGWFSRWFDGRVQALWFLAAGVAIRHLSERETLARARKILYREGGILIGLGLLASLVYQPDLLLPLGFCVLLASFFLKAPAWSLWPLALVLSGVMVLWAVWFDLTKDWVSWTGYADYFVYRPFWEPGALFRRIFINGYYPVFTYLALVLVGYWLGAKNMQSASFRSGLLWLSLLAMIGSFLGSVVLGEFAYTLMGYGIQGNELFYLFRIHKAWPMPMFMANTIAWVLFLTSMIFLWSEALPRRLRQILTYTGFKAPYILAIQIVAGSLLIWAFDLEHSLTVGQSLLVTALWLIGATAATQWFMERGRG